MLLLILAHGHHVAVVDEDIRRHEHRVREQPVVGRDALGNLLLVGMAALQQPHRRHGGEHPGQLAHLGHIGLQEQHRPLRIQAQRQEIHRLVQAVRPHGLGVANRGEGMVVGDEVEALMLLLELNVLLDGAEVVAYVQRT